MPKPYTTLQQRRIDQLKEVADSTTYLSAVVDLFGGYDADGKIGEYDLGRRFEVRSMQHVQVYGFKVVYLGKLAREKN
jgi:hypothetical protein